MKKLTLVSLLAKTSQPVLTHDCLFTFSMSKGTERPSVAHIPHEILTNCCSRLCRTKHQKRKNNTKSKHCHLNLQCFSPNTLFSPNILLPPQKKYLYNYILKREMKTAPFLWPVFPNPTSPGVTKKYSAILAQGITGPFNILWTLKIQNSTDKCVYCYHQSNVWRLLLASDYYQAHGNQIKSLSTVQTT